MIGSVMQVEWILPVGEAVGRRDKLDIQSPTGHSESAPMGLWLRGEFVPGALPLAFAGRRFAAANPASQTKTVRRHKLLSHT